MKGVEDASPIAVVPTRRGRGALWRVALPGLAVLLPGIVTALLLWQWHGLRRELDTGTPILVAERLAATLDAELSRTESALRVLATSPAFAQEDWRTLHAQAKAAAAQVLGNNIVIYDTRGYQLMNTLVAADTPMPDRVATPAALLKAFSTQQAVLSDVFVGPVTGTPLAAMGVPIARPDRSALGIGVGMSPDQMARLLERSGLPGGWIAAALDRTGTIAARTRESARFVGQKAVSDLVDAATARAEGTLQTTTKEGIEVMVAFRRIERLGWTVAVAAPKQPLDAARRRETTYWIAAIVLACALSLTALFRGIRWHKAG